HVHAGVVDEHVQRLEARDGLGGGAAHVLVARDVAAQGERTAAGALDFRRDGACSGLVDVEQRDRGALEREAPRDRASDPGRGARDERNFAREIRAAAHALTASRSLGAATNRPTPSALVLVVPDLRLPELDLVAVGIDDPEELSVLVVLGSL